MNFFKGSAIAVKPVGKVGSEASGFTVGKAPEFWFWSYPVEKNEYKQTTSGDNASPIKKLINSLKNDISKSKTRLL